MAKFLGILGEEATAEDPQLRRNNIQLGVNYKRFSKEPVVGRNLVIRF